MYELGSVDYRLERINYFRNNSTIKLRLIKNKIVRDEIKQLRKIKQL